MLVHTSVKMLTYLVRFLSYVMKLKFHLENVFLDYSFLFALVQIGIALMMTMAGYYDAPHINIQVMFSGIYVGVVIYTHSKAQRFHFWISPAMKVLKK